MPKIKTKPFCESTYHGYFWNNFFPRIYEIDNSPITYPNIIKPISNLEKIEIKNIDEIIVAINENM